MQPSFTTVEVVPFLPFSKPFTYAISEQAPQVAQFDIVEIHFGKQNTIGLVTSTTSGSQVDSKSVDLFGNSSTIKNIESVIAQKIINTTHYQFITFASQYNADHIGNFLKLVFPFAEPIRPKQESKISQTVSLASNGTSKSKYWQHIQEIISNATTPTRLDHLMQETNATKAVISSLIKKNLISLAPQSHDETSQQNIQKFSSQLQSIISASLPPLSPEQKTSYLALESKINQGFSVSLLDGETGSGKTEVYFWIIQTILKAHDPSTSKDTRPQILVMLPEISLANITKSRFQDRFNTTPTVWHSNVSETIKHSNYHGIINGYEPITISTRSGLFLPYRNLQAIIIDEEHDSSYKQDEIPTYNARDMAIARAKFLNIPIFLLSATPSVETYHNAKAQKYSHIPLNSRFATAHRPEIKLIDLKTHKAPLPTEFISSLSRSQLESTLRSGHQALMFINRRGYSPIVSCATCGAQIQCKYCDASLAKHKKENRMRCHQCGTATKVPNYCPSCQSAELKEIGAGAERILDEVVRLLPEKYKVELFTSDTMRTTTKSEALIQRVQSGEVDVIIGTQIISKGYHFKNLKFACVVNGDCIMSNEDYKSSEKIFQTISQVAGRSGREGDQGIVHIQTYNPDSKILKEIEAHNKEGFYNLEIKNRKKYFMPPFSRYATIVISGKDKDKVLQHAKRVASSLAQLAQGDQELRPEILGPVPAIISYIRLKYRFRILVISKRNYPVQNKITEALSRVPKAQGVSTKIDIDPINFY